LDFISSTLEQISTGTKDIHGVVALWVLGSITYLGSSLPRRLWSFFLRNFTTKMTIQNSSECFFMFTRWYEAQGYSKKARSIKISNGKYNSEGIERTLGYGTHFFKHNGTPVKLNYEDKQEQVSGTYNEQDKITLTILGRSHKLFDDIFKQVKKLDRDENKIVVQEFGRQWEFSSKQRKRFFSSLFLNKGVEEEVVQAVKDFKAREKFHLEKGISHQLAILLHGPPGTGKTSIIKCLASEFNLEICKISPRGLGVISSAFARLPENALVVVEDIDTDASVHKRRGACNQRKRIQDSVETNTPSNLITEEQSRMGNEALESFSFTNLSDVLNAIDGVEVCHGRILIATTNHIEKLDEALIRSGRFDVKIRVDYADRYAVQKAVDSFFPGETLPEFLTIKENLPPADIQKFAIDSMKEREPFKHFLIKIGGHSGQKREDIQSYC